MFYWPVRIYYEDTDSGGVVYYANYLKFMERARSEWLRNLGFDQNVLNRDDGIVFAVRSASIEYLRPARLDDFLRIGVDVRQCRGAALRFVQPVLRAAAGADGTGDGDLLCTAEVEVACVDARSLRPRRIPAALKSEIERES